MPSVPISVALESTGQVAVGSDITITLTVTPLLDADQVVMTIALPGSVELRDGDVSWTGSVRAHENRAMRITVRPKRAALTIIRASVRVELGEGTVLGETRSLSWDLGDQAKPSLGLSPSKKTGTGEPVIEFREKP